MVRVNINSPLGPIRGFQPVGAFPSATDCAAWPQLGSSDAQKELKDNNNNDNNENKSQSGEQARDEGGSGRARFVHEASLFQNKHSSRTRAERQGAGQTALIDGDVVHFAVLLCIL